MKSNVEQHIYNKKGEGNELLIISVLHCPLLSQSLCTAANRQGLTFAAVQINHNIAVMLGSTHDLIIILAAIARVLSKMRQEELGIERRGVKPLDRGLSSFSHTPVQTSPMQSRVACHFGQILSHTLIIPLLNSDLISLQII